MSQIIGRNAFNGEALPLHINDDDDDDDALKESEIGKTLFKRCFRALARKIQFYIIAKLV